jgi:hypothetical protein
MKHTASRELYGYWDRIRAGAPAPRRSEVEPSDIRRILADTFILEVVDRETYLVRLAGTRICNLYCREVKSSDFLELWGFDDRQAVATMLTAIAADAAGAVVSMLLHNGRGQTVGAELLLLPLRHGASGYDRILGSCATFARPYWLGTDPVVRQEITSLRLIWPDESPQFLRRSSDAESQPTVIRFPDARRRKAHLTVLEGGKS